MSSERDMPYISRKMRVLSLFAAFWLNRIYPRGFAVLCGGRSPARSSGA